MLTTEGCDHSRLKSHKPYGIHGSLRHKQTVRSFFLVTFCRSVSKTVAHPPSVKPVFHDQDSDAHSFRVPSGLAGLATILFNVAEMDLFRQFYEDWEDDKKSSPFPWIAGGGRYVIPRRWAMRLPTRLFAHWQHPSSLVHCAERVLHICRTVSAERFFCAEVFFPS